MLSLPSSCEKEVLRTLKDWNSSAKWNSLLSLNGLTRLTTPVQGTFGTWIYLEKNPEAKTVTIAKQTQKEVLSLTFNEKCQKKVLVDFSPYPKARSHDGDLSKLIQENPHLLIYVWSVEMPLSIRTLQEVKKLAQKEKLQLKVFLYDLSSPVAARRVASLHNFPPEYLTKVQSFEFNLLGVTSHQPVLFRYEYGKLVGPPLFGYKSLEEYESIYKKQ